MTSCHCPKEPSLMLHSCPLAYEIFPGTHLMMWFAGGQLLVSVNQGLCGHDAAELQDWPNVCICEMNQGPVCGLSLCIKSNQNYVVIREIIPQPVAFQGQRNRDNVWICEWFIVLKCFLNGLCLIVWGWGRMGHFKTPIKYVAKFPYRIRVSAWDINGIIPVAQLLTSLQESGREQV